MISVLVSFLQGLVCPGAFEVGEDVLDALCCSVGVPALVKPCRVVDPCPVDCQGSPMSKRGRGTPQTGQCGRVPAPCLYGSDVCGPRNRFGEEFVAALCGRIEGCSRFRGRCLGVLILSGRSRLLKRADERVGSVCVGPR